MLWYYAVDNQQCGPIEQEELVRLAQSGQLRTTDLIWNPCVGKQWVPAGSQPWLACVLMAQGTPSQMPPRMPDGSAGGTSGATPNGDLTRRAREALGGHWGPAIGVIVLNGVIVFAAALVPVVGQLSSLLLGAPMNIGLARYFLRVGRGESAPGVGMLFDGFRQFGHAVGAQLLVGLFTLLWTLLLIIPGIIASYSYSMTFFVLADQPEIGCLAAIRRSKELMRGNKWKLFCLQWRFFGWALLCLLTLGIGFLWLTPYMATSVARFYDDICPAAS